MCHSWEDLLIEYCAPTLAGIKAASLFRCQMEPAETRRCVACWDQMLKPSGIRLVMVRETSRDSLIYLYRPLWLDRLLFESHRRKFLEELGYQGNTSLALLAQLARKLENSSVFPHEIGLFLGYPLRDVKCFIQYRGENYTCCGCWKSYGNPVTMEKCFARYHQCTDELKRRHAQGVPVIALVNSAA